MQMSGLLVVQSEHIHTAYRNSLVTPLELFYKGGLPTNRKTTMLHQPEYRNRHAGRTGRQGRRAVVRVYRAGKDFIMIQLENIRK